MKLNHALLRELLEITESEADGCKNIINDRLSLVLPDFDQTAIDYHLKYLRDIGFIEGVRMYTIDITPEGRVALELLQQESEPFAKFHKFVSQVVCKASSVLASSASDALGEVAKSAALKYLGL